MVARDVDEVEGSLPQLWPLHPPCLASPVNLQPNEFQEHVRAQSTEKRDKISKAKSFFVTSREDGAMDINKPKKRKWRKIPQASVLST